MKKSILILVMSLIATLGFAKGPVDFGLNLRYGMPRSEFKVTEGTSLNDYSINSENGYSGGLFLRINWKKFFAQTEAMYSFQKLKYSLDENPLAIQNYSSESVMKSRSLDVPILVGYNIVDIKLLKLKIFTGPTIDWMIKPDENIFAGIDKTSSDWAWTVGGGVEAAFVSFDVRYGFDINSTEGKWFNNNSLEKKTNVLSFTLGLRLF